MTLTDSAELSTLESISWILLKHYSIEIHMDESDFTEFFTGRIIWSISTLGGTTETS